jgi:recombination DNA repair RAD52 pathway protein
MSVDNLYIRRKSVVLGTIYDIDYTRSVNYVRSSRYVSDEKGKMLKILAISSRLRSESIKLPRSQQLPLLKVVSNINSEIIKLLEVQSSAVVDDLLDNALSIMDEVGLQFR